MPKVAYSEEEREQIRARLIDAGLELISKQGMQRTTVEQIYRKVGISRTFFYTFFSSKEDLIVETLYLQQPRIIEYARSLMADPALSWREAVERFLHSCFYGEKSGIATLSLEDQQRIFRHLSAENDRIFRQRQTWLFEQLLDCFGIAAERQHIQLLTNLVLSVLIIRKAVPDSLPFLVPEAIDEAVEFQTRAIADYLESLRPKETPV